METFPGANSFQEAQNGSSRELSIREGPFGGFERRINETLETVDAKLEEYKVLEQTISGALLDQNTKEAIKESFQNIKDAGKKFGKFMLTRVLPVYIAFSGAISVAEKLDGVSNDTEIAKSGSVKKDAESEGRSTYVLSARELAHQGIAPLVYSNDTAEAGSDSAGVVRDQKTAEHAMLHDKAHISALDLKKVADDALRNSEFVKNCNKFTAYVASAFGHRELEGKLANMQVAFMKKHWKIVDAKTAQEIANRGGLVIAGLEEQLPAHGHTIVVVPGKGATKPDKNFYPNVQGGGISEEGRSDGSNTAGDVFNVNIRSEVLYFTPQKG